MYDLLNPSPLLFAAAELSQWLEGVNGGGRVFLTLMVLGALVLVAAFGFSLFDKIHRRNAEIALKRDMIERGLSVEEIERLLTIQPAKVGKLAETQPYTKK